MGQQAISSKPAARPTTANPPPQQRLTSSSGLPPKRQEQPPPKVRPRTSEGRSNLDAPQPARERAMAPSTSRSVSAGRGKRVLSAKSDVAKKGKKQNRRLERSTVQQSLTNDEAHHLVEELRRQQNEDLLLVLEQEQRNETDREIELAKVTDVGERKRLEQ